MPRLKTDLYKIIEIIDGDTVKIVWQNQLMPVRARFIDCPEVSTEWGERAKDKLVEILSDGQILIHSAGGIGGDRFDRYGRLLGDWFLPSGEYLQEILVRQGLAVEVAPSKRYLLNKLELGLYARLLQAQYEAHRDRLGFWGDKDAIALNSKIA